MQVKQQVLDKLTNPEKEARTERITVTVNQQNEGDRQEVKRKVMISHKEQPQLGQVPKKQTHPQIQVEEHHQAMKSDQSEKASTELRTWH